MPPSDASRLLVLEAALVNLSNHLTEALAEIHKDVRELRAWVWGSMGLLGGGLGAVIWGIWGK